MTENCRNAIAPPIYQEDLVWLNTTDTAKALNFSKKHLLQLRADGTLEQRKHWKDIRRTKSARATYRWHLKNCEQALCVPPERRKK